jgi:hypothetical protein
VPLAVEEPPVPLAVEDAPLLALEEAPRVPPTLDDALPVTSVDDGELHAASVSAKKGRKPGEVRTVAPPTTR